MKHRNVDQVQFYLNPNAEGSPEDLRQFETDRSRRRSVHGMKHFPPRAGQETRPDATPVLGSCWLPPTRGLKVGGFDVGCVQGLCYYKPKPHGRKVDGFGFDPAQPSTPLRFRPRGRKAHGFGFDPAHPTCTTNLHGRKADGLGFDPAQPSCNTKPRGRKAQCERGSCQILPHLRASCHGFGFDPAHPSCITKPRGLKIKGLGFDPAYHPECGVVEAPRGRKRGGFGFEPDYPTPKPAARGRKRDGFGFDPAHPTPNPRDRGRKTGYSNPTLPLRDKVRTKRSVFPTWEAPTFHEVKQNVRPPVGKKIILPPGGATTLVLN